MSSRGRWLLAVAVLASLAVQATVVVASWRWNADRGPQLHTGLPAMDRAIADVLAAAGDDAAVSVDGLTRSASCSLGTLRTGGRYSRTAELYVPAGNEDALLSRLAAQLPAGYRAKREAPASLTAAGVAGVRLSVRQLGDGWLVADADSGCVNGPASPSDTVPAPDDPAVQAVTALFATLGTTGAGFTTATVGCPNGQTATVAAVSQHIDTGGLADRLKIPPDAHADLVASANRVAYRTGRTSVVASASDDGTQVVIRYTNSC